MLAAAATAASSHGQPEDLGCRLTLHTVTGHLVVRMASCSLEDASLRSWVAAQLLPRIEVFRGAGHTICQADLDFSRNQLTDAGLASFLKAWSKTGLACPLLLKLHFNRLTDQALVSLAGFIRAYRGQVRELHLTNNSFSGHEATLEFLHSFAGLPQYPMWIRRQRRHAPVYVRLGQCSISEPQAILEQAAQRGTVRLCLTEEGRCSKTLCCMAERGNPSTCPVAHLYGFLDQGCSSPPELLGVTQANTDRSSSAEAQFTVELANGEASSERGLDQGAAPGTAVSSMGACAGSLPVPEALPEAKAILPESSEQSAEAAEPPPEAAFGEVSREHEVGTHQQRRGESTYACGACGRSLPLDMFGRHQFRKAAAVDAPPAARAELAGGEDAMPAHLLRRCKDCVTQPCSACGTELPVSHFARGQMMRPRGQRRCRSCAAETVLCARCGQPKPRSAFSVVEVHKRKLLPRVCGECEQTNPYFERRYALVLAFTSPRCRAAGSPMPRLPLDVLRRIVDLSEPGDEFICIRRKDFQCDLCCRSWSISTNDVERHVRHSQVHRQRLEKLRCGSLVRIGSLGLDASRFRNGLGIRGAVCSRERVEEAAALVHVREATAQGLAMEALRAAGLAPSCDWVPPRVVEVALSLQLGKTSALEAAQQPTCAEIRSAQRRWKLFGHLGAEAEHYVDATEELSAVCALLSSNDAL